MREVEYKDPEGRLTLRLIPLNAPDSDAVYGIVIGPPPLAALELPHEIEVRLNNEFYHRGLLTERDLRKRRLDAAAAVMAACRLDIDRLLAVLQEGENHAENGTHPAVVTDKSVHNRGRVRSRPLA